MSILAFLLIIISAFIHATWNYLSKRAGGGVPFVWLFMAISSVAYAPLAIGIILYQKPQFSWIDWLLIIGSMLVHLLYFVALQKGYKIGEFSVVYPVARGTGPMISSFAAVFVFSEHITIMTFLGIIFIVSSVFLLTGGTNIFKNFKSLAPVIYGLIIGTAIAGYTIIDKGAVSIRLISPLLLEYFGSLGQFILLTPYAIKQWKEVRFEWKQHRVEAFGVGILHSLAYILVLTAMVFAPVSHIAPLREISILIGALMGAKLLSEEFGTRRLIATGIMVVGVIMISFD